MKRAWDEPLLKTTFNDLPEDIQYRIIIWNKACEVSLVSKQWFQCIIQYPDWYDDIHRYLTHRTMKHRMVYLLDHSRGEEDPRSEIRVSIPALMEAMDKACHSYHQEFKNRFGLFLRKAFLMYMRGALEGDERRGSMMFNSAMVYLRHSKPNALLTITNFHPRDFRINFFEKDHRYNLISREHPLARRHYVMLTNIPAAKLTRLDRLYEVIPSYITSGTTFIHPLFQEFVEDEVITKMMASRNWPNSPYFGLTREQIKGVWEKARTDGTKNHANLEAYCCGRSYSTEGIEWIFFKHFEEKYVIGVLVPYRAEWLLYSEVLRLTGSVDMLYGYKDPEKAKRDARGKLHLKMCDWKFARDLLKENNYQKGSKPCTAHMPDTKVSHYNIQLFIYTYLLIPYDIVIDEWFLVGMHSEQEDFIKVDYQWNQKLMDDLIAYRMECLREMDSRVIDVTEFLQEPAVGEIIKKNITPR